MLASEKERKLQLWEMPASVDRPPPLATPLGIYYVKLIYAIAIQSLAALFTIFKSFILVARANLPLTSRR